MRGIASILVVMYHAFVTLMPDQRKWIKGSFMVVEFFFVLSAFLVTSLLLRERRRTGTIRIGRFYWQRLRRLMPVVAVYVVFQFLFVAFTGQSLVVEAWSVTKLSIGVLNYYLRVYATIPAIGLGHLWYISAEMQIYAVLPFVVLLLAKIRRPWISMLVLVGVIIGGTFWRQSYNNASRNFIAVLVVWPMIHLHIGVIAIGVLLAYFWQDHRLPRTAVGVMGWLGLAFTVFTITRVDIFNPITFGWYFTLTGVASACLIMAMVTRTGPNAFFEWKIFRALGKASYSIFVWHLGCMVVVGYFLPGLNPVVQIMLGILLTAITSTASWYFIERHFDFPAAAR